MNDDNKLGLPPKERNIYRWLKSEGLVEEGELEGILEQHPPVGKKELNNPQLLKVKTQKEDTEIYPFGDFVLDISRGNLRFKKNKRVDINPKTKQIKLLLILLNKCGNFIPYQELADQLDLGDKNQDNYDSTVARSVQDVKKKLVWTLCQAGVTKKEITLMIKSRKGYGLGLFV